MSKSNRNHRKPQSDRSVRRRALESKVERQAVSVLLGSGLVLAVFAAQAAAPENASAAAPLEPTELAQVAAGTEADAAPAASGETELDTVVISAKPRIAALKDKPQSVSVVSGESLSRLNALTVGDITQRAGNVTFNQGNARTSSLSIRGIGRQAQTDAMDPSVGFVVDGVPYAYNPLASFDFIDIGNVEVLRGPQGTQGGKNASVGQINVTTNQPRFEREFIGSVFLGQQNTVIARAAIGGGIVPELIAWRGAFSVQKGDGFIKNAYNRDISYPNRDAVVGRVQFLFTPLDNLNATLRADYQPRVGQFYNGFVLRKPTPATLANGSATPANQIPENQLRRRWFTQDPNYVVDRDYFANGINTDSQFPLVTSSQGYSGEVNYLLGDHTLTSITAWKNFSFQAKNDEGTPFDINKNGGGNVFYNQASQELKLSGHFGSSVDYTSGLYLLRTFNNYDTGSGFGSDAGAFLASNAIYSALDGDAAGRLLLSNSVNRLIQKPVQEIRNRSGALFTHVDWHITEPLTLTAGLRFTREDRRNNTYKQIFEQGFAPELNPAIVNDISLGGFASNAFTAANPGALSPTNTPEQLALADATALKYFGVASYANLTPAQQRQVAAAKQLRAAQIGPVWNDTAGPRFQKTQPTVVFSPSYRFSEQYTGYVSFRYGEKAGISQVVNSVPFEALPEETRAYELGLKTALLDNRLTFNTALFWNDIKNYQQQVQIFDAYTTELNANGALAFTAATGNAAKVRARGVEIDALYRPIDRAQLRLAVAYNDAYYRDFQNSGQPFEQNFTGNPALRDVSGSNLPGAAKWSGNLGADYNQPVGGGYVAHANLNLFLTSAYNSDVRLSEYGRVSPFAVADLAFGVGPSDQRFDVSVLVKNLLGNDASQNVTHNTYVPATPRFYGLQFSTKL
ncbi:MAG: TonB-dependent receptor [Nevskia sp.]|uniref:TonB-dependent receptor n=1 Tax=Nevskia sp. TaxID=1929292 RepID=UPI0040374555